MSFAFVVRRRDMLCEECMCCELGVYIPKPPGLDEDTLECAWCDHSIPRWLTKKECLKYYAAFQKEVHGENQLMQG